MSDDQQIGIPMDVADDCSAEQPPKDDTAACPVQSPTDDAEMSDVGLLTNGDDAAGLAPPPPNDDAISAPMPNVDDGAASPPEEEACPAPPLHRQIPVPVNMADDSSAEQPPKDDDDDNNTDVVMFSDDDDAAGLAPPPNDGDVSAPMPNVDDGAASPPEEEACPAPPLHRQIPVPVNIADDCSAEQPPMDDDDDDDDDEYSEVVMSPHIDDIAASIKVEDASSDSLPEEDASSDSLPEEDASSDSLPEEDAGPATPPLDDIAHPAYQFPLPKVEPGISKTNRDHKGFIAKKEIKQENKDSILVKGPEGFDRGLEPDRIVGAADMNGKLMFYLTWKNSKETDLIEASEIYENCPELAIEYYEAHLVYYPHAIKH